MKKHAVVIVMIMTIIILSIFLASCSKHEHQWVEATCTEPKKCAECDETEGEAFGHDWVEASCTEAKTCSRCGATEGEALGHQASKVTCTDGAVCERCKEEIPALGHDWVEATCKEAKKCSRCGETEGEALGHSPADPVKEVKVETSCTTDGTYDEVVNCSRCKEELSRETKTETAFGHSTDNGVCSRCGQEIFGVISRSGDDVVSNIELGDGIYRAHITNNGGSNFAIWCYDANNKRDLLVNEIGAYDGYVYLQGTSPLSFEVTSSGNWEIQIQSLSDTDLKEFSGVGDYVTDKCTIDSGTYRFTHNGDSNFAVIIYTKNGRDLLVNEIGSYDGKKILNIPSDSKAFFVITASGEWSITKEE